jgi:hypothetical protein
MYVTEFIDGYFSEKKEQFSILTYTVRVRIILATIMLGSYLTENTMCFSHKDRS